MIWIVWASFRQPFFIYCIYCVYISYVFWYILVYLLYSNPPRANPAFRGFRSPDINISASNGRYGGGSAVCEYSFGPVTFEWGPNASQKQLRGAQNHPKARPGTIQKAAKVNPVVPRSKKAPKVGPTRFSCFSGHPITRKKL